MLRGPLKHDDAFERLYREQGDRLWRAVLAFSGDREVASDAVSEAFAQVLRRGEAVRDPARWVWRAAFRIASGELADRRRRGGMAVEEGTYEMPSGDADVLMEKLQRLSPNQRASLVLHYYAGYPIRDIARIVGSTAPAIRVHLSRGRKRLRTMLSTEDVDA